MIGFLLDNFIGPILVLLGIIEIQENGDWVVCRRKKEESHYNKEEKPKQPSFLKKIGGAEVLFPWRKRKTEPEPEGEPEPHTKSMPPEKTPLAYEPGRLATLKRIPKMEGIALAKTNGKRICYTDKVPKGNEIEKDVLYIVRAGGEPIAYSGPLAGIMKDGYYIYDTENDTYTELGGYYGWKD